MNHRISVFRTLGTCTLATAALVFSAAAEPFPATYRGVFFNPQVRAGADFPWLLHYPVCREEVKAALQDLNSVARINLVSIFVNIAHSLATSGIAPRPGQQITEWANTSYYDNVATFLSDCHDTGIAVEIDLACNLWVPYSIDPGHQISNSGSWPKPDDTPWDEAALWYRETITYIETHTAHPESIAMWSMSGNAEWGEAEPCLWDTDHNPAIKASTESFVKQVWPVFRASGKRPKASPILLPIFSNSTYWTAKPPEARLSAFRNLKHWLVDDLAMPPDYWVMSSYPLCDPAPDGYSYLKAIVDILGRQNAACIISSDFKGPGHDQELKDSIISGAGQTGPQLLKWHFDKCQEYGFGGWWIWSYQDSPSQSTGIRDSSGNWKPDLLACLQQAAAPPHSARIFTRSEIDALRARIGTAPYRPAWETLHSAADAMITPGASGYADPREVSTGGESRPDKLRGNLYGGRLVSEMETLGFAFRMTDEMRYAEHGIALLLATAESLPVSAPPMSVSYMDGVGAMMRGLALGYEFFAERMPAAQRAQVELSARSYIEYALAESEKPNQWWVPYHNYAGAAYGGAGLLALAVRDAFPDEAEGWIERCTRGLTKWFDVAFDPQGAYCEGTSYCEYGLRQPVLFMHALKNAGGPDLFQHAHLRPLAQFFAMSLIPGEFNFDARNDAYYKGLSDPLWLRIAEGQQNGLARWLWDTCGSHGGWWEVVWHTEVLPVPPEAVSVPLTAHFTGRGLCIARTGWSRGDIMYSIEAGPFHRKIHNQADKGSFNLYGYGHRWAVDNGYGNSQDPAGPAQSIAHNVVLIDGCGQALSGAGLGTSGKITAWDDSPERTYVAADLTEAYRENSQGAVGVPLRRALRYTYFVKAQQQSGVYIVIADEIEVDDRSHEFTWQMHLDTDMTVRCGKEDASVGPAVEDGSRLELQFSSPDGVDLSTATYAGHPVLHATVHGKLLRLVTVLLPRGANANSAPPVQIEKGRWTSGRYEARVRSGDWQELLSWEQNGTPELHRDRTAK